MFFVAQTDNGRALCSDSEERRKSTHVSSCEIRHGRKDMVSPSGEVAGLAGSTRIQNQLAELDFMISPISPARMALVWWEPNAAIMSVHIIYCHSWPKLIVQTAGGSDPGEIFDTMLR